MNKLEQQRFTIIARGCATPMFVLFIVGILLLAAAIPISLCVHRSLLSVVIPVSLLILLYGLLFGAIYGRTTILDVDTFEASFVMTVKDGFIRRVLTCCCPSGLHGTTTYKFTDVMRVVTIPSCGESQLQIYFLNGHIFNTSSTFKTAEATLFEGVVNGYLMQHAPHHLAHVHLLLHGQSRPNACTTSLPLMEYAPQQVYTQSQDHYSQISHPPPVLLSKASS
ncbi:hypothetical protein BLNAU_9514 [Blattamonas nauphoetae]|uniref:Transmembrane protein n=1 Tax=Blattamonas nauphoetae TaxID=2049346 RepID=A0ABQ9XVH2_9EUKA|nr:hypothetical protein BLNAU_9514 [Blattamonas nauphoetae]